MNSSWIFLWVVFCWKFLREPGEVSVFVGQVGDCAVQGRSGEERPTNMLTAYMSIADNCTEKQERKYLFVSEKEVEHKECMWAAKM